MQIKCTGSTVYGTVIDAWKFSRPNETDPNIDEVKKLDLPVNEFLVLNLEIECTILEREIFTSISNHVIWAQTSRVQNILAFEIEESIYGLAEYFESVRAKMIEDSKTMRQDDYRLSLPLFSMTKFSTSISIRNLIKIMKYFHHLYCETDLKVFSESYYEMKRVVSNNGYYENHYTSWKTPKILCENFIPTSIGSVCGSFMTISSRIPMHLRAQLVRHRGLHVQDNLFSLMQNATIQKADLTLMVDVQVSGTIETFQEISSKRACWIAQYNIWSDFLNKITRIIPEMKLPCSGGACPFSEDAKLRYEGKDPNPPCPIHCVKNSLPVSRDMREKMYSMIKSDQRDTLYWGDFVRATNLEE
jgi:hypothetical protein